VIDMDAMIGVELAGVGGDHSIPLLLHPVHFAFISAAERVPMSMSKPPSDPPRQWC